MPPNDFPVPISAAHTPASALFRSTGATIARLSCGALLLCTLAGMGQQPPSQASATTSAASPPTVFKSTTALVLVDVVVTNGPSAVHGLKRDQFRLFEDGKEQRLIALEEHTAPDPATVRKQPDLPPNIYSNIPESPNPGTVNVLLLDALNTPIVDQANVRQQMIAYLKTLQPGTRLGVFTLASRLRIVQGITGDSRPLLAALSGKKGLPGQSNLLIGPGDNGTSDMAEDLADMGATSQATDSINQFQADTMAFQTDLRVRYTLDALQQLARYLRGVPGRKNLIWFSGSFPLGLDPDATLQSPFQAMRVYAPDVTETSRLLAAARVAVYPVDARGVMVNPDFNAETSGRGMNRASASNGQPKFARDSMKFMQQTAAEQATMKQIAEETGGQAFVNTNGLKEAVAFAIQNGASYYTLAYVPANTSVSPAETGRFHKLRITVENAPPYRLAYRPGYVAESAKKQAAEAGTNTISSAMMRGAPPSSEIVFKVRVLPVDDAALKGLASQPGPAGSISPKVKGPLKRYWIDYAADLNGASLAATPEGLHRAVIEFVALAYDRDGNLLNSIDKSFSVNLTPERYKLVMEKGLQMHQEIDLPAGEVYLRTGIHDLTSDRVGTVELPLIVKPEVKK